MVQNYLVEKNAAKITDATQTEWQVSGDFARMADYKAYSEAPVHLAIRKDFTEHSAHVTFLDVAI